jgi:hypothetical protein
LGALRDAGLTGLWLDASWFKGDFGPNGNWVLPISAIESTDFPGVSLIVGLLHFFTCVIQFETLACHWECNIFTEVRVHIAGKIHTRHNRNYM